MPENIETVDNNNHTTTNTTNTSTNGNSHNTKTQQGSTQDDSSSFSLIKDKSVRITVKVEESATPSSTNSEQTQTTTSHDNNNSNTDVSATRSNSSISLPPIDHILKSIDVYQTQQQLSDSQLLLEFNQRHHVHSPQIHKAPAIPDTHPDDSNLQQPSSSVDGASTVVYQSSVPPLSQTPTTIPSTTSASPSSTQKSTPYQFKNEDPSLRNRKKRSTTQLTPSSTTATTAVAAAGTPMPVAGTPTGIQNQQDQQSVSESSTPAHFETPSRQSSVESIDSIQSGSSINTVSNNKKRTNLPRETIEILNDWILNNMDNPYPNHTQKRILLERTGLSSIQLSNWFINKRRRRIFSNLSGNNGQPIKKKRLIDRIN